LRSRKALYNGQELPVEANPPDGSSIVAAFIQKQSMLGGCRSRVLSASLLGSSLTDATTPFTGRDIPAMQAAG